MMLFEHPDFEQAILQATEHFREQGLRAAIIEKDYYVTEALRSIATANVAKVAVAGSGSSDTGSISSTIIFKGGTSLSKGWNLIARFSEDIDIFLDPLAFDPPLGKRAIDRELKTLRDVVAGHPALTFVEGESQTIGGFGRNDRFSYPQRFGGPGEPGPRSGQLFIQGHNYTVTLKLPLLRDFMVMRYSLKRDPFWGVARFPVVEQFRAVDREVLRKMRDGA